MGVAASTGLRFFATGENLVRKTFDKIGESGRKMWAGVASGKTKAVPGMVAVSRASNEVKRSIDNVVGVAGPAGRVLSGLGPVGIAAAAGIGAATMAFRQAYKAMVDFATIGEVADAIGVTTDMLQEMRFVLDQNSASASEAEGMLKKFIQGVGTARAGQTRALHWFEVIGISREDLKNTESMDLLLRDVIRRIAALGNEAERQAVAEKLGLTPLLPAMRQGIDRIDETIAKAREMGVVIDSELIAKSKDAKDRFSALSQVIDVNLKQAFIDLAPEIIKTMELLANAMHGLAMFLDDQRDIPERTTQGLIRRNDQLAVRQMLLVEKYGEKALTEPAKRPGEGKWWGVFADVAHARLPSELDDARRMYQQNRAEKAAIIAELNRRDKAGEGEPKGGGDALGDVNADMQAKSFATAMKAAREKAMSALHDETLSIEERLQLDNERLDDEKKMRAIELAAMVKNNEINAAQAKALAAAEDEARENERHRLKVRADRERQDANLRYETDMTGIAVDMLRTQEGLALTAKERLAVQLTILEVERELARKALALRLDTNPNLTPEQRAAELAAFDRQTGSMRAGAVNASGLDLKEFTRKTTYESLHDAVHDAFDGNRSFLDALFGGIAERFAMRLQDELADNLFDLGDQLISQLFQGSKSSSGGGGLFASIIGGIGDVLGFAPGTGASGVTPGVRFRGGEHGVEMMLIGRSGRVFDRDATAQMLADSGSTRGSIVVKASYAPVYHFQGASEEIAQLRNIVDDDRKKFGANVHAAVNDGISRGQVVLVRK